MEGVVGCESPSGRVRGRLDKSLRSTLGGRPREQRPETHVTSPRLHSEGPGPGRARYEQLPKPRLLPSTLSWSPSPASWLVQQLPDDSSLSQGSSVLWGQVLCYCACRMRDGSLECWGPRLAEGCPAQSRVRLGELSWGDMSRAE